MKRLKQYFTITSLCATLFATLSVAGGCSTDGIEPGTVTGTGTDDGTPMPLTICATASSFDEALPQTPGGTARAVTRTPTQDGNTTIFNTGDAIGIFAIKDGVIKDGVSNMKLTYQAASNGTAARWTPPTGSQLYYYDGVSYIAYFPYTDGITIDPSQSTATIIASLGENAKLQPAADQSTAANYVASDLMTASGTPVAGSTDAEKTLTLNFTHSYCLLMVVPRIAKYCLTPSDGGFTYCRLAKAPFPDVNVKDVVLNGLPTYQVSADGSYRVIVKPTSASSQMQGSYTSEEGVIVYTSATYANGFAAGNSYRVNSDSPFTVDNQHETRALAPGDFVFHGTNRIEIYPGDGVLENGKIPDYANAIGIVVTCDKSRMTDAACNAKGWNHAYVMGLENSGSNMIWGPNRDESVLPNTMRNNGAENNMNGYTETEAMLAERASMGDLAIYGVFNTINTYRTSNAVPTGLSAVRSPWFVPSIGQWFDVIANIGGRSPQTFRDSTTDNWVDYYYGAEIWATIENQLKKAGKTVYDRSTPGFWCSSETGYSNGWYMYFGYGDTTRIGLYTSSKSFQNVCHLVRPFFAF